ncbi:peptidase domain-containing ABC transporter [Noviherbaspirillum malthae]|uniref:peptidase domain-containing ABC transporter n=1 Tax=Noviherbaspirillum malthae TaxID=1260987 RepID=UPI001E4F56C9|nr:peptidase domain-containing ABC transporter [Noviherbaspirillum malthae]
MNLLDQLHLGWGTRLPMVLQTEAAECGLACLAMIAAYHGSNCTLAELRRRFGLSLRGATLKDLVGIAERIGLASRPVRLEPEELPLLATPCLLHWELNHFVVLKHAGPNGIVIHDPAVGVRRLPQAEVLARFTGIAVEFSPLSDFEPGEPPPRVKLGTLTGRMVGLKRSLGMLAVMALCIEVFAVISPFFLQWVVDEALVTADRDLLLTLVLGFSLLLVIRVAVTAMRGWMLIAISSVLKVMGRSNLFSHLISLPAGYFEARHLGDVMSRFGSQETILQAITTDMVEALLDGLMSAITLAVMFVYAPGLAMVVLAGAALYALLRWATYTPLRHASMEAIVWAARRDSHFLESMRGIKTIKLFNAQESRRAYWLNLLVETVNRQIKAQTLSLVFKTSNALLVGGITLIVVWLAAQRVLDKTFSVGMLLAFIAYKDQFLSRVSALTDKALDLVMLRLHAERLADIALTAPEPRIPQSMEPHQDGVAAAVEVRNLRFRYSPNDPWVLDGINLNIQPSESVAIVGASGCGKTTLLRILASLLQPESGDLMIDGQDLGRIGIARYRAMIGVVLQDDQLFAGSIGDNISFFAESPSQRRIEECARQAAIHEDICKMPMGYSTLIGDMGTSLSGGQKQRVLIARALYHRPSILLLDEATSHLDIAREKAVNEAIRSNQMTRIIVAHRPETILSASRVVMMENGRIVDDVSTTEHKEKILFRARSLTQ